MQRKYSVILGNLGNTCDRFLPSGYKDQPVKEIMFKQAVSIPDVSGIELVGEWDITTKNVKEIKKWFQDNNKQCASIIPEQFSKKIWGKGAFTSRELSVRHRAIEVVKEMVDVAKELGCSLINIWNGQDGYDYPFQGNFDEAREWLIDGVIQTAKHDPKIRIALEYKPKEPRTHSYLSRAAETLLIALATKMDNVGVTIDVGHALAAGENMAEAAVLLLHYNKLFHLHFNDNYRAWDDDMIVGSVHHVEFIELLYWLRKKNYQGWYSMDQYPYREDAREAISESIETLKALENIINQFGENKIQQLISNGEATKISKAIRQMLLPQHGSSKLSKTDKNDRFVRV